MAGSKFLWFDLFLTRALDDGWISREEKRELKELLEKESPSARRLSELRAALFDAVIEDLDDDDDQALVRSLETAVKALHAHEHKRAERARTESLFFPSKKSLDRLLTIIGAAQKEIDVCCFTITDNRVVEILDRLMKRGVRVRVLSDNDKAHDKGSDIWRLGDMGAEVLLDRSEHHMHHKFAIIDDDLLLTGSYNWTRSAADKNRENILITTDVEAVRAYQREFEQVWRALS